MIQIKLDFTENLFDTLNSIDYEYITNGRQTGNIVNDDIQIPIVRTTTKYTQPSYLFQDIHYTIIEKIKEKTNLDLHFNHAMIEVYDSSYKTMGYHTDQAIDLEPNSYIAIFSCYENPNKKTRTLIVKNKKTSEIQKFSMYHNSVILFDTKTNSKYIHKIVLENNDNNKWLGITFRCSKTFIHFVDNIPHFISENKELTLANENEQKEFYTLKKIENKEEINEYPILYYTLNPSDFIPPLTH